MTRLWSAMALIAMLSGMTVLSQWKVLFEEMYPTCQETVAQTGEEVTRRIRSIVIEGGKAFSSEDILKMAKLKPKDNSNSRTIKMASERIKKAYFELGFVRVDISITQEIVQLSNLSGYELVDITIRINEGQKFYIRRVEFVGNKITKDAIVWRALGLRISEPYNPLQVSESIKRLNKLGRFERIEEKDVEVSISERDHFVDLLFRLKEIGDR